jgi:membrane-associated protease RseP (regulator of RpoE activity)
MAMNWIGFVIALAAALVVATIVHELGHYFVARRLGIPVKRLTVGLGPVLWRKHLNLEMELVLRAVPAGMAVGVPVRRTADGLAIRPIKHDLLMVAGGPAASIMLALGLLLFTRLASDPATLQVWLVGTAVLSVLLALLNLIPIPGLDGGHLLMLALARFGWELTPQQEAKVHRTGIHGTAVVCILLALVQLMQRL